MRNENAYDDYGMLKEFRMMCSIQWIEQMVKLGMRTKM